MPLSPQPNVNVNPSATNLAVTLQTDTTGVARGDGLTGPFLLELGSTAFTYAAMTTVVTGSPASCNIQLQGSLDGVNWTTIATSTSTTGDTQFSNGSVQFGALRVHVTAVSGGSSPTLALGISAFASNPNPAAAGGTPVTGTVTANQGTANGSASWPVNVRDGNTFANYLAIDANHVAAARLFNSNGSDMASTVTPALNVLAGTSTAGTSASAATGTGANATVDLATAFNNVSVVVTGTSTSYTVTLEGSADNVTFVPAVATSSAQTSTPFLFASTGKPLRYWRTNVTAIANGNVTTKISGAP